MARLVCLCRGPVSSSVGPAAAPDAKARHRAVLLSQGAAHNQVSFMAAAQSSESDPRLATTYMPKYSRQRQPLTAAALPGAL